MRRAGRFSPHLLIAVIPSMVWLCGARAGELDQSYTVAPVQFSAAIEVNQSWGQVFNCVRTGLLDRFELQIGRRATTSVPLNIEIRKVIGGLPDLSPSGLRYSVSVPPSQIPVVSSPTGFVGFDLGAAAFPVISGQSLTFCLSSAVTTSADWYLWATDEQGTYPAGTSVALIPPLGPNWIVIPTDDSGFRTYVAVPEPSSFAAGMLILTGMWLRRRRFWSV